MDRARRATNLPLIPDVKKPRAVLFDFGGTILREDGFDMDAGARRVLDLARNPRGLTAKQLTELLTEMMADLLPRRETSWLELSPVSVHRLVYEPNGISFDRPHREIELEFWRASTAFSIEPDITRVLERLAVAQVPMGVLSNTMFTADTLEWQLREFDVLRFFEFVMSSADYVVRKPHPLLFRAAAAKLDCDARDIWFAGDTIEYDMLGATSVGMPSVWYNPRGLPGDDSTPTFEVRAWSAFVDVLDRYL